MSIEKIDESNNLTWQDGSNVNLGTSSGSRIGTSTSQKLGFYNAATIVQPIATTDLGWREH